MRGQQRLHLPVSWRPPWVSKGTGLADTAGPLRFPAAHLESSGPRTSDAGVACPPGVPGLKCIFPALFSPPSLYRNDKWSGGLKSKNWSHESSDLGNFLYT